MPAEGLWPIVPAAPRAAATHILDARYDDHAGDPTASRTFDLAAFQVDAVRRARAMLSEWGGVLVADSVGLGKTYVALALLEEELGRGAHVVVVTPAALRAQWRTPLRQLGCPGRVAWLSHTRLSRGLPVSEPGPEAGSGEASRLVVVDEAHAFRNPRTRRYRELARLCRGARVVLLTATPVNNTLLDLYAQIRLFTGDGAFRDLGVPDLRAAFQAPASTGAPNAPPMLATVLRAVMIRRTRALIRELLEHGDSVGQPGSRFPCLVVAPALRYRLADAYADAFEESVALVEALQFAPFRVEAYARRARTAGAPAGAAELMRMLLLKRLESSVAAFAASVRAQIRYHESFLEHLAEGRLLAPSEHRALRGSHDVEGAQLLLGAVALHPLPRGTDAGALARDAAADLDRLRVLRGRLEPAARPDPKLLRLRALLEGPLAAERVLVFTEFRETATYLWAALRDRGGVALIHGGGAFLGRARCGRHEVVTRFAPHANAAVPPPPREAVRLLIATDVLSEGLNLQDARHIVSYDLPWNPVRLIQRVGRIDRLGSRHATVLAHTFLPDDGLERLLRLLDRIRAKLAAIRAGVGDEPAPLADVPAPGDGAAAARSPEHGSVISALVDDLARGDGALLDEIDRRDAAAFDAEERLRIAWLGQRRTGRGSGATAASGTVAAVLRERAAEGEGVVRWLFAVRVGARVRLLTVGTSGAVESDAPAAFDILWRAMNDEAGTPREDLELGIGAKGPMNDETLEPDHDALRTAAESVLRALAHAAPAGEAGRPRPRARVAGPGARAHGGGAVRAVSRLILRALAAEPGGPGPALCGRAESILARIARGLPIGVERELVTAAERSTDRNAGADALCARIEHVLASARPARDAPGERAADRVVRFALGAGPADVEWIAAIEVRPAAH